MLGSVRLTARGVATAILSFGLAVWGFWTLGSDFSAETYRKAATYIEAQGLPDATVLGRLESSHAYRLDAPSCRRDLTKAVATIRLARLDALAATSDAAVLEASDTAARTLRYDLACRPSDGNLWFRLAFVEIRRQGLTAEVESLLRLSAWTMPTDNWILADRIQFLGPILQSGVDRLNDLYDKDAERFARYARVGEVVELYLTSPRIAQGRQVTVWDQLGPVRSDVLRIALDTEVKKRSH